MTVTDAAAGLPPLMTPLDLSEYLGVPLGTLANWRYQGRGPDFVRMSRLVRYRAEDVIEWINDQVASAPGSAERGVRPGASRPGIARR